MATYRLYRDGQSHGGAHLVAVEAASRLDMSDMELVATIEATHEATEWSASASAFQVTNEHEYIQTGLPWPNHCAVVVH